MQLRRFFLSIFKRLWSWLKASAIYLVLAGLFFGLLYLIPFELIECVIQEKSNTYYQYLNLENLVFHTSLPSNVNQKELEYIFPSFVGYLTLTGTVLGVPSTVYTKDLIRKRKERKALFQKENL